MTTIPEVPLTGRAPTSPCDFYVITKVPAAHIEHAIPGTLNTALVTAEIVTGVTLVKGGQIQGLNVTITLAAASTMGTTACPIYAKLDLGTGLRSVSGRASVIEARMDIGVGESVLGTMSLLCLDFNNLNIVQPLTNVHASYIALRQRPTTRPSTSSEMNNLFNFMDITAHVASENYLFCASTTVNGSHKIRFLVGNTKYWLVVSDTAPD